MTAQNDGTEQFVRIDLRFSGSFTDMDMGDISGVLKEPASLTCTCDDDDLIEDLADALEELGLDPEALVIVDVEGDGFRAPQTLDLAATEASGWPRFKVGGVFTRFLSLGARADEPALRAVREAYSMATVRAQGPSVVAYDEYPNVSVNVVTDPEESVDTRAEHTRLADGLVEAVDGALKAK